MNPQFNEIGTAFANHYYTTFPHHTRANLQSLFNEQSLLTWEGKPAPQFMGMSNIMTHLMNGPSMNEVQLPPTPTTCDCQPMTNGSILVMCTGDVKIGNDNALKFSQSFVLNPNGDGWIIGNTIFKLNYG